MNLNSEFSLKRIAVSKANAQVAAAAAIAAFITVFCLVAINYLWGLHTYQAKILSADKKADNQLKIDITAKNKLVDAYSTFVNQSPNVLGSQNQSGTINYNNSTIILDALPSQYDFPALATSIAKLIQSQGLTVSSLSGTDDSTSVSNAPSANPQSVSIPFSFTINAATYQQVWQMLQAMQSSIRPLQIDNLNLTGSDSAMSLTVNAHTYFQPGEQFQIGSEKIER